MWWFAHIRSGERGHGNHFSKPFGIGNHNHIKYQTWIIHYPNFPSNFILLVCQVCCCAGARIILHFYFRGLSCTKSFSNACFFRSLSCTKSCSTLWFLAWCVFWEIVAGGFSAMFAIFNLSWRYWLLVVVLTKLEDCYSYFELISSCTKWCSKVCFS